MRVVMLTCVLGLTACLTSSGSDSDELSQPSADDVDDVEPIDKGDGSEPPEVCEVEPEGLGVLGQVPTHGTTLSVTKWVPKTGAKGKYVGFELSRKARFTVLAGTERYKAEGTSWVHPKGASGTAVTGIDLCDDYCEDNGGGDGGGGGGLPPVE